MVGRTRTVLAVLAALVVAMAAACGQPDDDRDVSIENDAGGDTMQTDGSMADTGGMDNDGMTQGCMADEDCSGSQVCLVDSNECVECIENNDCTGANQVCESNTCQDVEVECSQAGDDCDPNARPGEGFACVETGLGNKCVKVYAEDNNCGAAQVCLPSQQQIPEDPQGKGLCLRAQCQGPLDSSACENMQSSTFFQSFPNGAKCASVTNRGFTANICVPEGQAGVNEACTDTFCTPGEQGCTACQAGLSCVDQVCQKVCTGDDGCSEDNESCVQTDNEEIIDNGLGFCAEGCTAYSRGECSVDGEGCYPLNNEDGFCRPEGDTGYTLTSQCETHNDCKAGHVCRVGFCTPACDAPPSGKEGEFQYDNTCRGEFLGRFLFLGEQGGTPGNVDLYLNGERVADDLPAGEVSDNDPMSGPPGGFFRLTPGLGESTITAVEGSAMGTMNPLAEQNAELSSGPGYTWSVYPTDSGWALHMVPAPRFNPSTANNESLIRVVHEVVNLSGNVDVVAAPVSNGTADLSNSVELGTDLALEDVGELKAAAQGDYVIYVFPTGTQQSEGNELVKTSTVTLDRDRSFYLYGDADDAVKVFAAPFVTPPYAVEFTCWNPRGNDEPDPASGVCLEGCTLDDYGRANCNSIGGGPLQPATQLACQPINSAGSQHVCLSVDGGNAVGDSCSSGQDCPEGAFCDTGGGSQGTCVSYCIGGDQDDNDALKCGAGTECTASDGNFGECATPCQPKSPTDLTDDSCPANKKNCIPSHFDENGNPVDAYCTDSGSIAAGQTCGDAPNVSAGRPLVQNCQPGNFCTQPRGWKIGFNEALVGMWLDRGTTSNVCVPYEPMQPNPTCRQMCNPFADGGSECPDGQACALDLAVTGSQVAGVCIQEAEGVEDPSTTGSCDMEDVGRACADASTCVLAQGSPLCYEFCRNGDDCRNSEHVCNNEAEEGGLGICAPPQDE